jgi:hypothetical protein
MILAAKLSSDDTSAMSLLLHYDMLHDARHNFSCSNSSISSISHSSSSSAVDMISSCGLSPLSAALQCGNVNISAVLLQVRLVACHPNALLHVCYTIYNDHAVVRGFTCA